MQSPSTSAPPGPTEPRLPTRSPESGRMLPFLVGCALFMQMLDSTVVTTALPTMAVTLGSDPVRLNVAITSYLLSVAVFVPISGWAADRFGAKRVFITAIALFTLSSLTCALSRTLFELVLSRIAQGVGGAMMVPVGRIILLRTVPKHELLRAMAFLSIPALLGPMIGPPVGGFLVTYMSWHWIFLINLPIGVLGIWMVRRHVQELPNDGKAHRLDLVGFILSAVCMATLVGGFEALGQPDTPWSTAILLIAVGALCGALYVWHARYRNDPILDLSLMRIQTFRVATLAGNLCRFTVGATPFLLAMLLQVGFGLSAMSAGLITFVGAVGAMIMKVAAPPILKQWGYRRVLSVNALLTGVAVACCAAFTSTTPIPVMLGVLLVGGFFRSLQFTAINTLAYADISHASMSRASSFAAMAQQLGVSLGVGVAASTLNLSMMLRSGQTLTPADVISGFLVIGLLCAIASLSFHRLPDHAGEALHQRA